MLEFPWAALPLIQFPAPPIEIDTAAGITAFLLQDMVYRDPVLKSSMGLLDTFEYVLSLVMVDGGSNPLILLGRQFHGLAPLWRVTGGVFSQG
jgi:hypothetical protein